jgi:hypothetical protein
MSKFLGRIPCLNDDADVSSGFNLVNGELKHKFEEFAEIGVSMGGLADNKYRFGHIIGRDTFAPRR